MAGKNGQGQAVAWQDKIHEVEFSVDELKTLKKLVSVSTSDVADILLGLVVDNNSVKVKSSEHFSSYTFSYTLDRSHPVYPGHTFWFWDTDIERGLAVMAAFVNEMLADFLAQGRMNAKGGLW